MHLKTGLLGLCLSCNLLAQTAPAQPATGPGGLDYPHAALVLKGPFWPAAHMGDDSFRYYVFQPASPTPAAAPVVLFLHAWLAYNPNEYLNWISHIVRKGHTVVWVQYDKTIINTLNWAGNATIAWSDALRRIDAVGFVRPERDSAGKLRTAVVGHSAGGYLAAIVGVRATRFWNKIPNPNVIVSIEPGGKTLIPGDDLAAIPAGTKMLLLTADADMVVCNTTATYLWNNTPQIAAVDKDFLYVQSDSYGSPALIADHYFPNNTGRSTNAAVDARDYFITFKLTIAALSCAFRGSGCSTAFGKGALEQVTMGNWSDGIPVRRMLSIADPNTLGGCAGK